MMAKALYRSIPKVELHVHFDGALCNSLLHAHLNSESPPPLPSEVHLPWRDKPLPVKEALKNAKSFDAFNNLCTCKDKRSLEAMLECFEVFTPIIRGNFDLIEENARKFVEMQKSNNVVYTELRYSPHFLAAPSPNSSSSVPDARPIIDAVTRGLESGCREHNICIKQILCCLCFNPEWSDDVVTLCEQYKSSGPCNVVGIDVAAGEQHFDSGAFPKLYQPTFDAIARARSLEIPITLHAGENTDSSNVHKAVKEYGAKRVGHGYRIVGERGTYTSFSDVHFECCPTSSYETGGWNDDSARDANWTKHPMKEMMTSMNLSVSINSDDPTVFATDISEEYSIVVNKMGVPTDKIKQSNLEAIGAAFCTDELKAEIRSILNDYDYDEVEAQIGFKRC